MTSRQMRAQSQPRPRLSTGTRRPGQSFEAWENVNDNARPSSDSGDRRSKSSMRYKSATRDSSRQRMRTRDPSPRTNSNGQTGTMPLAPSESRTRPGIAPKNEEQGGKSRESPLRVRQDLSMSIGKNQNSMIPPLQKITSLQRVPSLQNAPSLRHVGSNVTQEELQAEERLKKAENKISGLLQELDELRFFQELEGESPTKTQGTLQTPSNSLNIPINIRAVSPAKGGRLPPPPPSTRASKSIGGGLETYQPLSPRKIAKLDRNSLELECQTLVRKLQIVDQEKRSQAAMIEMYEISMQEHDSDKRKIKKLEEELKKVSMELRRQLQNIQKGKESLVKEYEARIQKNTRKLEYIQEKADSFKADVDTAKADAEKWKKDSETWKMELQERTDNLNDLQRKHRAVEEEFNSLCEVNSSLVDKVEKKRSEIATLKEDLTIARKSIKEGEKARNQKYEERIAELEQHLRLSKEHSANLETQCLQIKEIVSKRDKALDAANKLESENAALVTKLKSRVSDLERENETRFEEGKRAAKAVENKRMQELVAARANETMDYERRLKAMQEQLRHQSDRHHAEIEETQRRNEENLSLMREEVKEEIRRAEGDKVSHLDSELKIQKRNYEQMKADYSTRIREHQQKAREVAADFQQKNKACQNELESMHARLEELDRSVAQKDSEILLLQQSLQAAKSKFDGDIRAIEARASAELETMKQLLDNERKSFKEETSALQREIDALKASIVTAERKSQEHEKNSIKQIRNLQERLAEAKTCVKENEENIVQVQELKMALQAAQNDLISERARNEEVESDLRVQLAKLEGKLRASESNLHAKRARLHEIEQTIEQMNLAQSRVGEETESVVKRLTKNIEDQSARLAKERSSSNEKDTIIEQLREEIFILQEKVKQACQLEASKGDFRRKLQECGNENDRMGNQIDDLEEKVVLLETELVQKERELVNLRQDYQEMSEIIEKNLHSNMKDEGITIELKKRESEMKETVNIYNRQHSDLETKMKTEINSLNTRLQRCESERDCLMAQLANTKVIHDFTLGETRENPRDANAKEGHLRHAVQHYTQVIADLETKLDEESHIRSELEDKLTSVREELEKKQEQTQELVHRHTKNALQLESDLHAVSMERDELQMRLERTASDPEYKQKEQEDARERQNARERQTDKFTDRALKFAKKEQTDYRETSELTKNQLDRKEKQLNEMKQKIPELLAELDFRTRERDQYKASVIKTESELSRRRIHFEEIIDHQMKQISDLQSRLKMSEDLTVTRDDLETVRLESGQKDQKIRELNQAIKELESMLEIANNNTNLSRDEVEKIASELDEKRAKCTELEMRKIELESKLHTLSRAKDELRTKVTELTSKVERKEREVREVTDRYKIYVMELESKLDQESDAKNSLRHEIENLKGDLSSVANVSVEASELREKVRCLQREVDESRAVARQADTRAKDTTRRLEARLESTLQERDEIEGILQKLTYEKSEVINALEGVINEVQNREDEIESLTEILQRRDEELQHAKVIATKALQSAKDIQKRYKEKEKEHHSGMMDKIDELQDNIDRLSSINDSLQRKISMLERDLCERNLECQRLKDQLRQVDGTPLRNVKQHTVAESPAFSKMRDDGSICTQNSFRSSTSRDVPKPTMSSFHGPNGEASSKRFLTEEDDNLSAESFSPSNSTKAFNDGSDDFTAFQDTGTLEPSNSDAWESSGSYEGMSRRKIEQNALRDYVRQRFANR